MSKELPKVWLACWVSWDYDRHSDPQRAFASEAEAKKWVEKKIQSPGPHSTWNRHEWAGWYEDDPDKKTGWELQEVDWGSAPELAAFDPSI